MWEGSRGSQPRSGLRGAAFRPPGPGSAPPETPPIPPRRYSGPESTPDLPHWCRWRPGRSCWRPGHGGRSTRKTTPTGKRAAARGGASQPLPGYPAGRGHRDRRGQGVDPTARGGRSARGRASLADALYRARCWHHLSLPTFRMVSPIYPSRELTSCTLPHLLPEILSQSGLRKFCLKLFFAATAASASQSLRLHCTRLCCCFPQPPSFDSWQYEKSLQGLRFLLSPTIFFELKFIPLFSVYWGTCWQAVFSEPGIAVLCKRSSRLRLPLQRAHTTQIFQIREAPLDGVF